MPIFIVPWCLGYVCKWSILANNICLIIPPPPSENGAGKPLSRVGEDSWQGAGGLSTEIGSEGAGAAEHEKPDVQPAGRLREPAGRQIGSGHGDQCLQEDAGGGGTKVWLWSMYAMQQMSKASSILLLFINQKHSMIPGSLVSGWLPVGLHPVFLYFW